MSLPHALLGLLARHPASGYDLCKLFDTSLSFVWPATRSQLYAELTRLAATGLIEPSAAGPRGRREYAITSAGRQELVRWLTEAGLVPAQRNQTMLRVFFLWVLPPDTARAYLAEIAGHSRAFHERLRHLATALDAHPTADGFERCGRIMLEHGLRTSAAQAEWADWASRQLPSSRGGSATPHPTEPSTRSPH
ncbi:MAG TPA: PadR family transcriptional regulator [Streptosporangiaceae bacterium]|nr:PadR family transcriptional regulator [Streptosporangiaceae bacterium]